MKQVLLILSICFIASCNSSPNEEVSEELKERTQNVEATTQELNETTKDLERKTNEAVKEVDSLLNDI